MRAACASLLYQSRLATCPYICKHNTNPVNNYCSRMRFDFLWRSRRHVQRVCSSRRWCSIPRQDNTFRCMARQTCNILTAKETFASKKCRPCFPELVQAEAPHWMHPYHHWFAFDPKDWHHQDDHYLSSAMTDLPFTLTRPKIGIVTIPCFLSWTSRR